MNRFGPYRLIRPLSPLPGWERWIALHEWDDTDHVIYRHASVHDSAERRRLLESVEPVAQVSHAHLLAVEAYSFDEQDHLCLVTPYTGNQEGLVTLADLVDRRSGRLEAPEVARSVAHLLEAVGAGRAGGLSHGPLDPARILVDRRGSLRIELFGLPLAAALEREVFTESDEVRSVAEMAVWLLTGLRQDVAPLNLSRIAGRAAKPWEAWVQAALDPVVPFDDAASALEALPGRAAVSPTTPDEARAVDRPLAPFSGVLRRFRKPRSNAWDITDR